MLCSDMVVIDIDVKLGKNGLAEYEALGGDYDTLVVRTPSGGYTGNPRAAHANA